MISKYRKLTKYLLFILIFLCIIFVIISNLNQNEPYIIIQTFNQHQIIDEDQLVNYHNFNYLIENDMCKENFNNNSLLGIILVTSYVGHDDVRSAHRSAISQKELMRMGFLRIFLLAKIPTNEKLMNQDQINNEQKRYGDMMQGNFLEAYRNLTYKHIMGLKWANKNCKASFIIKIDDDIVFDVYFLKYYLTNFYQFNFNLKSTNFIVGYVLDNKIPVRLMANKWFTTYEEYSKPKYPDYASGWLYITTINTAKKLVYRSQIEKFFWIDDTFITGIIRENLNIQLIRINNWFSANSDFIDCCIKDIKKYSYECDYHVGPNGGDTKLIEKFIKTLKMCNVNNRQSCMKRPKEKELKRTCVGYKKNILNDHGEALIRKVKL